MLQQKSFRELLVGAADHFGSKPFILDDSSLGPVPYSDVLLFASALERKFDNLGIPVGAPVATVLHNCGLAALLFLGVIASRRLLVPINPISTPDELEYILKYANCSAVIADPTHTLANDYGPGRTILVRDHYDYFRQLCKEYGHPTGRNQSEANGPHAFTGEVVFTSGSTGRPKGVVLSERNLIENACSLATVYELRSTDRFLTVCPLFHNSGQVFTTLACALVGGSTVPIKSAVGMLEFWSLMDKFRANWSFGMVSFLALLLTRSERPTNPDQIRGILTGGSAIDAALIQRFETEFKVPVRTVYGLTETASIATCEYLDPNPRSFGSSGRALPSCNVRIECPTADQNSVAKTHSTKSGEILISGPTVFEGYLNDPELTSRRKIDGWVHTGDVGYFDDNANLFVVDRLDSMLIVGGENVYPAEVERLCGILPGASQIVLVGLNSAIWGKELVLIYKLANEARPAIRQWRRILEQHVAAIKVPQRYISIHDLGLDDFPRKDNGKLDRTRVTALASMVASGVR